MIYMEALNKRAVSIYLEIPDAAQNKKFRFYPFCGKRLEAFHMTFDKGKTYELLWDEELNTGIPWIDNQHRKFLEIMNILLNSIIHEDDYHELEKSLKFLQNYVKAHFGTEEGLMQQHGFPGYMLQKKQHYYFNNRIEEFIGNLYIEGISRELAMKVAAELWKWFKGHIVKKDREFGEYLKNRGLIHDQEAADEMMENIMKGLLAGER